MWILLITIIGFEGRVNFSQISDISSYKQCVAISKVLYKQYRDKNENISVVLTCINPKEVIK